jgi:hypothetical protein
VLTATYDQASLPIQIVMVDEGNPTLRLDNVLISNKTPYAIEINGVIDNKEFGILPSAATWSIDDPTICHIDNDGILTGITNGKTIVHGILGNTTLDLGVEVQTLESDLLLWEDMINVDQRWTFKATSSSWQTAMQINEAGLAELYLNYSTGRNPKITMTADTALYATPRFFDLRMTPPSDLISRIDVKLTSNNGIEVNHPILEITADQALKIQIDLDSIFGVNNDIAIYPIQLNTITLTLNAKAEKQEYRIPFEGIYLHYGEQIASGVECVPTPEAASQHACKVLEDGQLIIIKNNKTYNILGHEITQKY